MYSVVSASQAEFLANQAQWDTLVARMAHPTVFCGWEWMRTWWQHFGDCHANLRTLMVYRADTLIGVLPLYRRRPVVGRDMRVGQVLCYGGAADLYPDPLDLICAPDDKDDCLEAILTHLQTVGGWDVVHLRFFADVEPVTQCAARHDFAVRTEQVSAAPYILLPDNYENYLATVSANERSNIRRRRKKLIDAKNVSYVDLGDENLDSVLNTLFELHEKRADEKKIDSSFGRTTVGGFHRDLIARLNRSQVWLRGLRSDGTLIAVFYGFAAAGRVTYYQLGYDPAWSAVSPGAVLLQETIREAIERGMHEYNFLQGEEGFKYRWTSQARPLYAVDLYNRTLAGHASRFLTAAKRSLKQTKPAALAGAGGNP